MRMKLKETTIRRKDLYQGRILTFHVDEVELENGEKAQRECVDHPGGVSVAVLTNENEMYFVRQFRYPYQQVVLETPAGKLEPGEDPFEAVKREQREETGTTGKEYQFLGNCYPTPGYTNEVLRLYACRVESEAGLQLDEGEFLEVERIPLKKAVDLVMDNTITDAKTIALVLKTARLVEQGKL